jgi:hypothetical protein
VIPIAKLRAGAFVVVALAALAGVISRVAIAKSDGGTFVGVEALGLSPGHLFGRATFDGTVNEGVSGVKLRVEQCGQPIYAVPIELKAVAFVEAADRGYLGHPGYAVTNVYHKQIRRTFSHFDRVLARNPLTPYNLDYFLRFYSPSDCVIDEQAYVEWADGILDAAIKPSRPIVGH